MQWKQHAFTLIEIVVAVIILFWWVFWIYRLIALNEKLMFEYEQKTYFSLLEHPLHTCILFFHRQGFFTSTGQQFWVSFGDDRMKCELYNHSVTGVYMDGTRYDMEWKVLSLFPFHVEYDIVAGTETLSSLVWKKSILIR